MKNIVIEIIGWIFTLLVPVMVVGFGIEAGTLEWLNGAFLIGVGSILVGQGILQNND